jgi:NAD(P)-dependent dehydrogenase (short-subunit alcohol dehydrogenase family)
MICGTDRARRHHDRHGQGIARTDRRRGGLGGGWRGLRQRQPDEAFGEPWEVAGLVAFLLSDDAPFINGAIVPIDGGQSQAY